eukprot:4524-Heterococcus_DN1.PRE.4
MAVSERLQCAALCARPRMCLHLHLILPLIGDYAPCLAEVDSARSHGEACGVVAKGFAATPDPDSRKRLTQLSPVPVPPVLFAGINDISREFQKTFTDPGVYEYVCTIGSGGHCRAGMYQKVIVT